MDKISVVIPTWNEEKNIGRCISYILRQSIKPYEIIVVDKFSKDKTVSIAKKFGAKVVYSNLPLLGARLLGAKKAKGEWIFFTDADTLLIDRRWFEKALIIAKIKNSCFITGTLKIHGKNLAEKLIFFMWKYIGILLKVFTTKDFYPTPFGFLIKKEVFEKIKLPTEIWIFEDITLTWLASKVCKIKRCFSCKSLTSPRRMRKMGYLNFCIYWVVKFFQFVFKGLIKEKYEAVR